MTVDTVFLRSGSAIGSDGISGMGGSGIGDGSSSGFKSLATLVLIYYLCRFLYSYYREQTLAHCPKNQTVVRKRPFSFKEWANGDDRTWNHFKDMFEEVEPSRFHQGTKTPTNDDLEIPDYGAVINQGENSRMEWIRTERKIIQHPELDRYLRALGVSEREAVWEAYFKEDDISIADLERFRIVIAV